MCKNQPKCAISKCTNNRSLTKKLQLEIHYHGFPKNEEIRKIWIEKCDRQNNFSTNSAVVCSIHFTKDDYLRDLQAELLNTKPKNKLKPTAVPTLYLDGSYALYLKDKSNLVNKTRKTKTLLESYSIKKEEKDECFNHNQVFLPESNILMEVQIKQETVEDEVEKLVEVPAVKIAKQESDPLTTYHVSLVKYNELLKERDSLKMENDNLRKINAAQNERIRQLETEFISNYKARRRMIYK